MPRAFIISLALVLFGCGGADTPTQDADDGEPALKPDEHVVFFRTAGWLDEAAGEWHLPVHGWVYEPQDSSARKAVFVTALDEGFGLTPDEDSEAILDRRLNLLIADNERGKTLTIRIAGQEHALPASTENGHVETVLRIPAAEVDQYGAGNFISYSAVLPGGARQRYEGEVRLVEPTGISVISDIDDTVKISNVTDKTKLIEYTFLRDFEAAPGMADLYSSWSNDDVSFHFVSSSPWQLYSPLTEFLDASRFPWATLSLKPLRFRDETFFDLFRKGTETKPAAIEKILAAYPGRVFVLVGDSGEQDPEVYAALSRKYPEQIARIYIRNVTQETPDNERFTAVFAGIDPSKWVLFDDPHNLGLPPPP